MADAPMLTSARVLVVGASSGIGRSFAHHAVTQGADVCVVARRADNLAALCAEAGGGHPIRADITEPDDCRRLVAEAADHLGGLDLILHSAGAGTLARIEEADADAWRRNYAVNALAPTLITAAALPHLAPDAVVAFLSSESTTETRWGMSAYTSSKAALEATIRSWRVEHPQRRFLRIVMGATMPTDFGTSFDASTLGTAFERWMAAGVSMTAMETDDVGRHLAETLAVILAHPTIDVPELCLDPRGEAWTQEEK
ncbi:MAG: short-chain dehydrogenase/reductase [Acidimicrobiales bacterium]|nr:short-chain dehydrogenase/reductase [Acidimicrobiales bacterium]